MKVMTSRPTPRGLNLTLLTPHPGALLLLRAPHSNVESYSHPLDPPVAIGGGFDVLSLSVWMTFNGFVLRTSHTTTTPSCDATANFEPFAENAVENDAGTGFVAWYDEYMLYEYDGMAVIYGESDSFIMCEKVTRAPPVTRCKYTSGESPTERSVRPSGEMDAAASLVPEQSREVKTLTMIDRHIQAKMPRMRQSLVPMLATARCNIEKLDRLVVVADDHSRLRTTLV